MKGLTGPHYVTRLYTQLTILDFHIWCYCFVRFIEFIQHAVEVENHWKEFATYVHVQ